jgi:hypothetical protein
MVVMGVASVAVCAAATFAAYLLGVARNVRSETKRQLHDLGLTPRTADLYQRAAKLLKSLVAVTDLDGPFGADVLSEETRKQVNEWLAAYRKEITKL